MNITRHARLREQQRAISPIMSVLIEEYGLEWQCHYDRYMQLLPKGVAKTIGVDAKNLIRELKYWIKVLKRVEKKSSSASANIQVISTEGAVITEANSNRAKRRRA